MQEIAGVCFLEGGIFSGAYGITTLTSLVMVALVIVFM